MISSRTKLRKNKNEINIVLEQPRVLVNTSDETSNQQSSEFQTIITPPEFSIVSQPTDISPDISIDPSKSIKTTNYNNYSTFVHCQDNNVSHQIDFQKNNFQDVNSFLGSWSVQFNVPHNAVNALLKGLKTRYECS